MFRWVTLCVKTRKDDVLYRKAQRKTAILNRDSLIQKEQDRQLRMQNDIAEAEGKFADDNRDQLDAALKWESEQTSKVEDDYGGEGEDDDEKPSPKDEKEVREKPEMPVFNKEEFLKKWLEENPVIEIPS